MVWINWCCRILINKKEIILILHKIKVYPSKINLPKRKQLAWKIAEIASDNAKLNENSIEMVINRIIDNASVAIASLNRRPVISAREMAKKHVRKNGANLFGIISKLKFDCEWAAWANGTAVRELDFHDTFLAADYSHPGDNIPALLAVAPVSYTHLTLPTNREV